MLPTTSVFSPCYLPNTPRRSVLSLSDRIAPDGSISATGEAKLLATWTQLAEQLPCAHVSIAGPTEILFEGHAGDFVVLQRGNSESRPASGDDILWFASTTKLLTAICK